MKRAIQMAANSLGYEIHKRSWFGPRNRVEMMRRIGVNLVLDVGANGGQYASELRREGYKDRIRSYEPSSAAFAELQKATASDGLWEAINCGCGARAEAAKIHLAGNSQSSSLLPMLESHIANAPDSAYVSSENVSIRTLDEDALPALTPRDKVWLKIDTQGYEAEVIRGADKLMRRVDGLECEMSLVALYKGQPLVDEMLGMIYRLGFQMVGVCPAFLAPGTNYILQMDGTFLRTDRI